MKNLSARALAALAVVICLSGMASAADYEAGWGKGLDNSEVGARAFLKKAASRICAPGDSDYEKVRKLNQYVCDKAEYDYGNTADSLSDFVNQDKAICSGYAGTLAYLLDCVNVKNFQVTAFVNTADKDQSLHIWNAVYIDGKWLHVDPTWNDTTRNKKNPDGKYFLITGAEISLSRQKLSLDTPEEYDHFYELLKTASASFEVSGAFTASNYTKQELAQPGYQTAQNDSTASPAPESAHAYAAAQDGEIFVPAQEAAYALGGYVKEADGGVTIILGTKTLVLTSGSDRGILDGEEFTLNAAPQMVNGRVMIPARAALEKLGARVSYDEATSEVTIFYDPHSLD